MNQNVGRTAILDAFDELFDKAAHKLRVDVDEDAKAEAVKNFSERFKTVLRVADHVRFPSIPREVIDEMQSAIDELSPAQLAGYVASGPLAMKLEEIIRAAALHAAEQKLLDHVMHQADDAYGGN